MIAPTHILFAISSSLLFGVTGKFQLLFIGLGSILPDIDHPKSSIGRVFYPISIFIHKYKGHRTITHSILVWVFLLLIGIKWYKPLMMVSIGAITHLILDCMNKEGVMLLNPLSEKIFVLAGRKYRIRSGSRGELVIILFFIGAIFLLDHINEKGGPRGVIQNVVASYQMAYQQYEKQGLTICTMKGKMRHKDGFTEDGEWLVVGKLGGTGKLSVYDKERDEILDIPDEAEFLKAVTIVSDKEWDSIRLKEYMILEKGKGFYLLQGKWRKAKSGDVIAGYFIYEGQVELKGWEL